MTLTFVNLRVNGRAVTLSAEPRQTLAEALRVQLGLTGTHLGCEHGVCGVCTLLMDGEPIRGCLMFAVQAEGMEVTTIEGISPPSGLSPLQESFRQHHALQCGFCTPAMVLTLHALLSRNPGADEEAIREAISGNLCRCTGYQPIVEAALSVSHAYRLQSGRQTQEGSD